MEYLFWIGVGFFIAVLIFKPTIRTSLKNIYYSIVRSKPKPDNKEKKQATAKEKDIVADSLWVMGQFKDGKLTIAGPHLTITDNQTLIDTYGLKQPFSFIRKPFKLFEDVKNYVYTSDDEEAQIIRQRHNITKRETPKEKIKEAKPEPKKYKKLN